MNMRTLDEPNKSLFDQLSFTESEIQNRLEMLGIEPSMLEILPVHKERVEEKIHQIVGDFYTEQLKLEENALLIGDSGTLAKLKSVQRDYILDIFEAVLDHEYVNNRLRVGLVHKRIGVTPSLYLAAVLRLKTTIIRHIRDGLEPEVLAKTAEALEKVLYFDMGLIFESYVNSMTSELGLAKKRAETYAQEVEELSTRDPLTGLLNRRAMDRQVKRLMAHATRSHEPVSVVVIDLDKFKYINDEFGHTKGDEVLVALSGIIDKSIREDLDIACRFGGDEFVVILANCQEHDSHVFIERLDTEFSKHYPDFSFSSGVACTGPKEFKPVEELVHLADMDMYRQKHGEKPQVLQVLAG